MSLKGFLIFLAGYAGGRFLSSWVIKDDENDPTGFIPRSPGFGLDEIAEAAVIYGSIAGVRKLIGKVAR